MPCTAFAIWNALRKALVNNLAPMHKPDLGPTLPPPPWGNTSVIQEMVYPSVTNPKANNSDSDSDKSGMKKINIRGGRWFGRGDNRVSHPWTPSSAPLNHASQMTPKKHKERQRGPTVTGSRGFISSFHTHKKELRCYFVWVLKKGQQDTVILFGFIWYAYL